MRWIRDDSINSFGIVENIKRRSRSGEPDTVSIWLLLPDFFSTDRDLSPDSGFLDPSSIVDRPILRESIDLIFTDSKAFGRLAFIYSNVCTFASNLSIDRLQILESIKRPRCIPSKV